MQKQWLLTADPLLVALQEGHAFDQHSKPIPLGSDEKREAVKKARTALTMHRIIGQDSWVVVPLSSVSRPGHQLEGTRLTLVKVPNQPDAVEFSIRTPVTPPRWKDYDQELEAAWEGLVACLLQGDLAGAARGILTFGYYWYNFMPLARGTAAVGYTTILALLWAAGVPVSTPIPKDYQVKGRGCREAEWGQVVALLVLFRLVTIICNCVQPFGSDQDMHTFTCNCR